MEKRHICENTHWDSVTSARAHNNPHLTTNHTSTQTTHEYLQHCHVSNNIHTKMMKIYIISTNYKKYTLTVSMIHLTITFPTVVTLIKYMCKIKVVHW